MNVVQVNPNYIVSLWPQVEGYLKSALETGAGEYNIDQLKVMLVNRSKTLLVAEDNGKIKGAAAVSLESFPNDFIAHISAIGGRMIACNDAFNQLEAWCKAQGCTKIRGAAFESVARLWRQKFNFNSRYIIVEKAL